MEIISDEDYELFINSGQVSELILNDIVTKLIYFGSLIHKNRGFSHS
jgi:hypothetical protein